jgi:hypothetical protein
MKYVSEVSSTINAETVFRSAVVTTCVADL